MLDRAKCYFINLWRAVRGEDLYLIEWCKLQDEVFSLSEDVRTLEHSYRSACDAIAADAQRIEEYENELKSDRILIENLRRRITEKDALISQVVEACRHRIADFEERIAGYNEFIDKILSGEEVSIAERK